MQNYHLFVTCPRGLENLLADELQQQGCHAIVPTDGGVSAQGTMAHIYRINLYSRTASRVLLRLAHAPYRGENDIYHLAKKIHWAKWFKVSHTIKVKVEGKRASVKSLDFTALKIKDAICDVFREQFGERPSVDKYRPDMRIHAFLDDKYVSICLDTSGEALFKRGYRQDTGDAPLRENLAAGLLLLAGYDGSQAFCDPFCGSGTIAIEAAWIATHRPAGLMRHFAFEKFITFDKTLWEKLKTDAQTKMVSMPTAPIVAVDNDRAMTRACYSNAVAAKVEGYIQIETQDAQDTFAPATNGIMISNPPYGVRLAEIQALHALYPQMGTWLKRHWAGWTVGLLTSDRQIPQLMRLKPKRKIPLFNGALDCRLFLFDMVEGSHRKLDRD